MKIEAAFPLIGGVIESRVPPYYLCFLLLMLLFSPLSCLATPNPSLISSKVEKDNQPSTTLLSDGQVRPKIGLALSGGGAKGAAHVGVLQYLEQHNIPVDYITGTSIGAYVGGLYALGYDANEIETIMLSLDWSSGFSDQIPRSSLSNRDKQSRDRFNLPFDIGFSDGQIQLPKGMLRGQTMSTLYLQSTGIIPDQTSFDQLAIPFRAIAADISTGKAVVIDNGNLLKAMQASASVPGILQPIEIDGYPLVDGGIVSNLPANIVKEMGADIVISVDIGSQLASKEQLRDSLTILDQLSTIMTRNNALQQIEQLAIHDIIIRPEIDEINTADFSSLKLGFQLGREAANKQGDSLLVLSLSTEAYQAHRQPIDGYHHALKRFQDEPISEVIVKNNSALSEKLILENFTVKSGEQLNTEALIAATDRVYALNKFERAQIAVQQIETNTGTEDTKKILTLNVDEKSWGPNFFEIGFSWEEDFTETSDVKLDVNFKMTQFLGGSGELNFELVAGKDKLVAVEYYHPMGDSEKLYWRNRLSYKTEDQPYYQNNKRSLITRTKATQITSAIGINFSSSLTLESGISAEFGKIESSSLLPLDIDYDSYTAFLSFNYDSLDSYSFPTSGTLFNVHLFYHENMMQSASIPAIGLTIDDNELVQYEINFKRAISVHKHSFISKLAFATTNDEQMDIIHTQNLGGFLNLSGVNRDSMFGSHLLYGALVYQQDIELDSLKNLGVPLYMGTSIETGNIWKNKSESSLSDLIFAGSIFVGTETDFGPAVLAFGINDQKHKTVYLTIGKLF